MKTIAERRSYLSSLIEEKTVFVSGLDFTFIEVKHQTKKRPDPKEFIILKVKKTSSLTTPQKREKILEAFNELGIEFHNEAKLYVKLPEVVNTILLPQQASDNLLLSRKLNELDDKLASLIRNHRTLGILGKKNTDQPEFHDGMVNFNYFDQKETDRAFSIFSKLNFTLMIRNEKNCNLTFYLENPVDVSQEKIETRNFNSKTVEACLWILVKLYGRKVINIPGDTNYGISERCRIYCGEIEMIEIKKDLEHYYNLIVLIHSANKKESEIYFLTSEKAKEIYQGHGGKISACDLIKLLKNPETITKTNTMEEKTLSKVITQTLREAGHLFAREYKGVGEYLQIHHLEHNMVRISITGGDNSKKKEILKGIMQAISKKFPSADFILGAKKTTVSVSIEEYVNSPKVKRTKPAGHEILKPQITQPTEPKPETKNSDSVSQKEANLKMLLDDPLLENDVRNEILAYFQKQDVNKQARTLLAELLKK